MTKTDRMEIKAIQDNISTQPKALDNAAEMFTTYVRTLQFMRIRLKGIEEEESVHISQSEIEERFFTYPTYNRKDELQKLILSGEIEINAAISPNTGRRMLMYKALRAGAFDLYMFKRKPENYGPQTMLMKNHLLRVSLPEHSPCTNYFDAFIRFRHDLLDLFFTVDKFSERVHTPITNLPRTHRPNLLIDGEPVVSFDVVTMQPLLLGKILKSKLGRNDFSTWIDTGEDIYIKLQHAAGLPTRDEGKKRFFEILFAPPSNGLADMFGAADWILWVNKYKGEIEIRNPHQNKRHSNLAWLLQTLEVETMRKVWRKLNLAQIPFLTVHDEIIVKQTDQCRTEAFIRLVFDNEFTYYKLNK